MADNAAVLSESLEMTDWHSNDVTLLLGDCLERLLEIKTGSIDAVITDPPYPEIKRDYGKWTVEEWWEMIVEGVIPQVRRILKPTGSAVFILQPNSEHVGQMRGWLWEFMVWICRDWNMVQDAWWWCNNVLPTGGASSCGLMRASIKACIWAGPPNCYRNQENVLDSQKWQSYRNPAQTMQGRLEYRRRKGRERKTYPGGQTVDNITAVEASLRRKGATPFNCLVFANGSPPELRSRNGHGAGTPLKLAEWWTRYIVPNGGTVCDPFCGSGTMGVAAVNNGCNFVGIEKLDEPGYFPTAQERIAEALAQPQQLPMEMTER